MVSPTIDYVKHNPGAPVIAIGDDGPFTGLLVRAWTTRDGLELGEIAQPGARERGSVTEVLPLSRVRLCGGRV